MTSRLKNLVAAVGITALYKALIFGEDRVKWQTPVVYGERTFGWTAGWDFDKDGNLDYARGYKIGDHTIPGARWKLESSYPEFQDLQIRYNPKNP